MAFLKEYRLPIKATALLLMMCSACSDTTVIDVRYLETDTYYQE